MKSGLIITGKIIEMDVSDALKIEMPNGSVITLKMTDVEKVSFDDLPAASRPQYTPRVRVLAPYKSQGYYFHGSLGFPFGADSYGDPSLNISLMLSAGHTFNHKLALGLATGTDFYWWPNTVVNPVALEIKGRFQESSFTPYYSLQAGYGFVSSAEYWTDNVGGGLYLAPGLGISSKNREHSGWMFHVGFRYQEMSGAYTDWIWNPVTGQREMAEVEEKLKLPRLDLRFGYFFE